MTRNRHTTKLTYFCLLLIVASYAVLRTEIQKSAYYQPKAAVQKMKLELSSGMSPDGVLSNNVSNGWLDGRHHTEYKKPVLAVIEEYGKDYKVSNFEEGSTHELPNVPDEIKNTTKYSGNYNVIWSPEGYDEYAFSSTTYSYGNVFGYVTVGYPYIDFAERIKVYDNVAKVFAVITLGFLFYKAINAKQKKKS
jgi:hypothetical protein